jgi:hypothetical protein
MISVSVYRYRMDEDAMPISALGASASQTNYPILVNGYLCYSATDVTTARSGAKPQRETNRARSTEDSTSSPFQAAAQPARTTTQTEASSQTASSQAVSASSQPSSSQTATAVQAASRTDTFDWTRSSTSAARGTQIDLYA